MPTRTGPLVSTLINHLAIHPDQSRENRTFADRPPAATGQDTDDVCPAHAPLLKPGA
ncbi:hypothetical protein ACFRH6_36015 [Streptomyces sp. NPDC056749]|uniref:hypothetical protein n=1 Tax=Streptomyces sp. NPDC056749 TaxID=3345936 RepID=UPI0036C1020A